MRIVVVGATGTIGRAVVAALAGHEIVPGSNRSTAIRVDLGERESIEEMYRQVGMVDAVVGAAGAARFKGLTELTDEDFAFSLTNKLMGQVNLVRIGLDYVR